MHRESGGTQLKYTLIDYRRLTVASYFLIPSCFLRKTFQTKAEFGVYSRMHMNLLSRLDPGGSSFQPSHVDLGLPFVIHWNYKCNAPFEESSELMISHPFPSYQYMVTETRINSI